MPSTHNRVLTELERLAVERRARVATKTGTRRRGDTVDYVRRAIARHRAQGRSTVTRR
ncbi:hypothetical protein [Conexibacter arvalis]|uniref:Uncharacterized protein n=1 Tax=Conexibacter arvalis TaxID=912552 RepID=A0A840IHF1_9ACTN|nr:hypothetical protein [Conexibacter arvalis]MBB4664206.1 hypothetical protein [Conexibacter arvalis]